MIPDAWIPHRREGGEVIGWVDMTIADPQLVPIDRLGRARDPVDTWHEAEEALEEIGLRFLMDRFALEEGGRDTLVRIAHLYEDRIVLSTALTDAVEDVGRQIVVPFPAPTTLRPA
ncbi:hypothetical protein [Dietzia sp. PP-33]|jgi:hypothetical protein|uniref:hypothetical protein n=1 Tax=Dietzia sp. PP-33 TaxID=2957500 RepID=UPI0029B61C97|nr:hypothetical protein [Dietzia sp. PP-33]MDX2357064.1 hypothetical protein [Dietzia sp. PP-33]